MRTAIKKLNTRSVAFWAMGALICGVIGYTHDSLAQTAAPVAAPADAPVTPSAPILAPTVAEAPKVTPPPTSGSDTTTIAPVASTEKSEKPEKEVKTIDGAVEKLSETANGVAKKLSAKENMTLDDLNSTRQTIVKIEALIDLEKRLAELDKVRADREDKSSSFAGAIPSSALKPYGAGSQQMANPMPMTTTLPMPVPMPVSMPTITRTSRAAAVTPSFSGIEVDRIIGSGGKFNAVIKTGAGQSKTVQVGDSVDGATVTAITSAGVELSQDKTKRTLAVKNVQTVFGNSQ